MKVIFICTGNICRSPTAHAIAMHQADSLNLGSKFTFDSAGIDGYHSGQMPDFRSVEVGKNRDISFDNISSRKIEEQDFEDFDLILAMTRSHLEHLLRISPEKHRHKIKLFLEFCEVENEWNNEVVDPYYGGAQGFIKVFDTIEVAVEKLFNKCLK